MDEKKQYFVTFGSSHLKDYIVKPMSVMLSIEGKDFFDARNNLMTDNDLEIGNIFAFQYEIKEADAMTEKYGMKLYTKEELLKLKRG